MATIATRIGPADHGRRMTLEEFRVAEEVEGYRYQLLRGELHVEDIPNDDHGLVVCNLYRALALYGEEHPGVILRYGGGAEFRLWLPDAASALSPDLGVVLLGTPRDHLGRRNPALVAEVVAPDTLDRDHYLKRDDYLAYGIREYWIVDPRLRRVVLYFRDGDRWLTQLREEGDEIGSLVLPGMLARVEALWEGWESGE